MLRNPTRRRAPFLITLTAVAVTIMAVASVAVGLAMTSLPSAGDLVLTIDGDVNQFDYAGAEPQEIELGRNECSVETGSISGPLMNITAITYNKQGVKKQGAPIGLVEDGLGVNEKGNGNGQDCGRIDALDGGMSESLTLTLGPDLADKLIESIDFDFEAKYDAVVRIDFLLGDTVIGTQIEDLSEGSDSGPDSKFRDKYPVHAETSAGLFNGVTISAETGGISLEGGATWQYKEGDSAANHRTVFHLVDPIAEISIDVKTNGPGEVPSDGPNIYSGDAVTWTYRVTNQGNIPLTSVHVTDSNELVTPAKTGDDLILDPQETWVYTATGTATVGNYYNTGSVSASSVVGAVSAIPDPSSYFGVNPSLAIEVTNPPVVVAGEDIDWEFTIMNNGNVILQAIIVTEDGTTVCPDLVDLVDLEPDESTGCTFTETAQPDEHTTTFIAKGTDPLGKVQSQTSGDVTYFGGLACGQGSETGGAGLDDTPLASFVIGPDNGTKELPDCTVPVEIATSNGTEQLVYVGPPSGYDWGGVTGIVTIEWDVELPTSAGVIRTNQRLVVNDPSQDVVIPWCVEVVGHSQVPGEWFHGLDPVDGMYHLATAGGDTCLIDQTTRTVWYDHDNDDDTPDEIRVQTTEVFYVYNDPRFARS